MHFYNKVIIFKMRKQHRSYSYKNVGTSHRDVHSAKGNFFLKAAGFSWRAGCEQLNGRVAFEEEQEWVPRGSGVI